MYSILAIASVIFLFIQKISGIYFLKKAFLTIAVLSIIAHITNHYITIAPISAIGIRLFSMFFIGVAFFVWRDSIVLSSRAFYIALIVIALSAFQKDSFFVVYNILLAYVVFYIAYIPSGKIRNFNKVGDFSYGIYIYAFPVQQTVIALVADISVLSLIFVSFIITMICAFISWHVIENRCLQMKNKYEIFERLFSSLRLINAFSRTK